LQNRKTTANDYYCEEWSDEVTSDKTAIAALAFAMAKTAWPATQTQTATSGVYFD